MSEIDTLFPLNDENQKDRIKGSRKRESWIQLIKSRQIKENSTETPSTELAGRCFKCGGRSFRQKIKARGSMIRICKGCGDEKNI